eukprot:scaffold30920_cov45-Phaeocystis_antarctica.AAC.1
MQGLVWVGSPHSAPVGRRWGSAAREAARRPPQCRAAPAWRRAAAVRTARARAWRPRPPRRASGRPPALGLGSGLGSGLGLGLGRGRGRGLGLGSGRPPASPGASRRRGPA